MRKRIMAALLAVCMTVGAVPCLAAEVEAEEVNGFVGLDAEYHTQEEIRAYYQSHPIRKMEAEFLTEPSVTAPYALGELTEESKQDALNMLNLYRYIAGVPLVSVTEEAQNYAQAAALICAVNQSFEHHQERPEGMEDEMFSQAFHGAANSNLAGGGKVLSDMILAFMLDKNGDPNLGHRRRILDYHYTEAGFGLVTPQTGMSASATFVGTSLEEDKVISYPGQNQPLEYFGPGYAWSVIIPEKADESAVNVRVTNVKTGEKWDFSKRANNLRLGFTSQSTCAIFSPSTDYRDGDQYKVEITGITTPISYEVNMFWVGDPVPLESISIVPRMTDVFEGDTSYSFKVRYMPENATNKVVAWTSSDPDVAEPLWGGTGICSAVAKKPGTAIFTATSEDGGHTTEITVQVKPRATGVALNEPELAIGVGQTFLLKGTTLPEESMDYIACKEDHDENIVSVEEKYFDRAIKITGKAVGQTSLTAYACSNQAAEAVCKINVVEPVYTTDFYLEETEIELMKGDVVPLNLIVGPDNITCRALEWSARTDTLAEVLNLSESGAVAAVEDGIVTAKKRGKAVVTVKALDGSGKEAQCTVKVYGKGEKMDAPQLGYAASNKISLAHMWGCEYSMDLENWQDSNVFTDLEPGHAYTFYIRKEANEYSYMKAGDASEGAVFRTKAPTSDDCLHLHTEVRDEKKASCVEDGYTGNVYCEDCGIKLYAGEAVKAAGHDYVSKVTKEATVTKDGVRTYTCVKCKDSYTEIIPKLGTSTGADNISKAVVTLSKNTCNYTGKAQKPEVKSVKSGQHILSPEIDYTVKYINNVNIGTASVIITGKGDYVGTVTKNFSITARKGSRFNVGVYKYQITGPSSAAFAGLKSSKTAKVAIPKTVKIGGKVFKVTSVAKNAFKKTKVTSVSAGGNVASIGASAFEGCTRLSKVTVGGKATKIGANAFKNCKRLDAITIKSAKLKSVGKNALKGIKPTAKIKVPAKKLSAYKKLFKNKGQGKKVKIVK